MPWKWRARHLPCPHPLLSCGSVFLLEPVDAPYDLLGPVLCRLADPSWHHSLQSAAGFFHHTAGGGHSGGDHPADSQQMMNTQISKEKITVTRPQTCSRL